MPPRGAAAPQNAGPCAAPRPPAPDFLSDPSSTPGMNDTLNLTTTSMASSVELPRHATDASNVSAHPIPSVTLPAHPPRPPPRPSGTAGAAAFANFRITTGCEEAEAVRDWDAAEVGRWLHTLSLQGGVPADSFREQGVTGDVLLTLSDADLVSLGVTSLGDRRRILRSIARACRPRQPSLRSPCAHPGRHAGGTAAATTGGTGGSGTVGRRSVIPPALPHCRSPVTEDDRSTGKFADAAADETQSNGGHSRTESITPLTPVFGGPPAEGPPHGGGHAPRSARGVRRGTGMLLRLPGGGYADLDAEHDPHAHHMWGEAHRSGRIPHSDDPEVWRAWYRNLESVMVDAELWCDLIERADSHEQTKADGVVDGNFFWGDVQVDIAAVDESTNRGKKGKVGKPGRGKVERDIMTAIDSLYDLTPSRIEQLFTRFDRNRDGVMNLGEFSSALKHQELQKMEPLIKEVQQAVDCDGSNRFYLPLFEIALNRLKLADLCVKSPEGQLSAEVAVLDYCAEDVKNVHSVDSVDDRRKFLFSHRSPGYTRWIHMKGLDKHFLLSLSVKYHLHPIGVEDAWNMTEGTKVERYGNHYFVALNLIRLGDPLRAHESDKGQGRVQLYKQHVVFFVSGPPHWDTCISLIHNHQKQTTFDLGSESDDDSDNNAKPRLGGKAIHLALAGTPRAAQLRNDPQMHPATRAMTMRSMTMRRLKSKRRMSVRNTAPATAKRSDLWAMLANRVKHSHVRIREKRADFLMHEILAMGIDELAPIVSAYRRRLDNFHTELEDRRAKFNQGNLAEISTMLLDLKELLRVLRPLRHVLQQFCNDSAFTTDSRMYLEDDHERLEGVVDDIGQLIDMGKSVTASFNHYSDRRLNDTLFLLTAATAAFMPIQFVGSIYGMNFVQESTKIPGGYQMPELRYRWGYECFWAFCIMWLTFAGGATWRYMHPHRDQKRSVSSTSSNRRVSVHGMLEGRPSRAYSLRRQVTGRTMQRQPTSTGLPSGGQSPGLVELDVEHSTTSFNLARGKKQSWYVRTKNFFRTFTTEQSGVTTTASRRRRSDDRTVSSRSSARTSRNSTVSREQTDPRQVMSS